MKKKTETGRAIKLKHDAVVMTRTFSAIFRFKITTMTNKGYKGWRVKWFVDDINVLFKRSTRLQIMAVSTPRANRGMFVR